MPRRSSSSRAESGVAHGQRLDIGDRQREAGADQQVARRAHVDLRVEPRGGPVALGLAERGAQRGQAAAADERAEEQAVGAQHAADQRQRAGQVVDLVEHARADHQVEAGVGEGQPVLVALHAAARRARSA